MVCEVVSGYICNIEKIYSAEVKKLEHTVLSPLDRNVGQSHHIYQDSFYNTERLAQILLDRNRVCYTLRANGHFTWPRRGRQTLEKRAVSVPKEKWRNGANVEGQKTCANDKYNPWRSNCEHRKGSQENKHGNKDALFLLTSTVNSWRAYTGKTSTSVVTQFRGKL